MKPKKISETRRWFQQAFYDLKAAKWNLQGGFHNTVCFLAQQSSEKALKSLLFYLGLRRKAFFTHSIVEMIQEGQQKAPFLSELATDARELDLHYIPARYPNGLPSGYPHQFYDEKTAKRAIRSAEKIVFRVRKFYEDHEEQEIIGID
ncbi:MAG: HEPN domain-containing protein [Deltaproteobacteria bacterium]|nr:HEPN domain-containing protein [Deltaproteobacteria bacterium]